MNLKIEIFNKHLLKEICNLLNEFIHNIIIKSFKTIFGGKFIKEKNEKHIWNPILYSPRSP